MGSLHGEEDALAPPEHARIVREQLVAGSGESRFRLLPEAGYVIPRYQKAEGVEALKRWSASV